MGEPAVRCGNCEGVYQSSSSADVTPLHQVPHLAERLDPGSEVPYGECNYCGAFVYVVKVKEKENYLCGHIFPCECGEGEDLLRPSSPDTYPCGHPRTPGDDICSNLECNGHLIFE